MNGKQLESSGIYIQSFKKQATDPDIRRCRYNRHRLFDSRKNLCQHVHTLPDTSGGSFKWIMYRGEGSVGYNDRGTIGETESFFLVRIPLPLYYTCHIRQCPIPTYFIFIPVHLPYRKVLPKSCWTKIKLKKMLWALSWLTTAQHKSGE